MPSLSAPALSPSPPRRVLPWPAPALACWCLAWWVLWLTQALLTRMPAPPLLPWALAGTTGALLALLPRAASGWRRVFMAAGFPVSAALSGAAGAVPGWVWLLPLALLLAAYPLRAWRDAPLFPTPRDAFDGLALALPLPPGARLLDAGCGLGHGLSALRLAWPSAQLSGIEWSWPLRLLAAVRCPWAKLRQGDMWTADWAGHDLIYLFQRPESMARAWAKCCAELAPGAWLLSLDFEVPGVEPSLVLRRPGRQPVWAYHIAAAATSKPVSANAASICAESGR